MSGRNSAKLSRFLIVALLFFSLANCAPQGTSTINNGLELLYTFWTNVISPIDGPRCPYYPTCSAYARQAVKKYGLLKGTMIASERLQRCNGWHDVSHYEIHEGRLYDPLENNIY